MRTGRMLFVGRRHLLEKCRRAVDANLDVWLVGEHGVGKSTLAKRIARDAIYLPHCTPAKELLSTLLLECWRRGWYAPDEDDGDEAAIEKRIRRLDQKAATTACIVSLRDRAGEDGSTPPVIILDDFDAAPATVVRVCRQVAPYAIVIACGVSTRPSHRPFLFQFEQVEVPRLSRSESEELVNRLLDEYSVPARERSRLLRHVIEEAQGLPSVLHELVERAAKRGDLSLRGVRGESIHGHTTIDMTPGLVIGACVLLGLRYAVRGLGDADLTALAGISAAAFMGLRFYAYRLARPSRS